MWEDTPQLQDDANSKEEEGEGDGKRATSSASITFHLSGSEANTENF